MEKEYTTVVVDAMGGDNAPDAMIQGAVDATRRTLLYRSSSLAEKK